MSQAVVPPNVVAVDSCGRGLQIRFAWETDRFAHTIDRLGDDGPVPVLASVESDATAAWPLSPPIQQISVEQIGAAIAALGVGAAGQGHWSISVLATRIDDRPALQFDVAARTTGPISQLGSRYRAMSDQLEFRPLESIAATEVTHRDQEVLARPQSGEGNTYRWAYAVILY